MRKNVSLSLVGKAVAMAFLMAIDIIAARFLGINEYAEWVYFYSIATMLFWIGWAGINTSSKVFVSKCADSIEEADCITSAAVLRFLASVLISLIILLSAPFVAGYLGYPIKYPNLKTLLMLAAVLVFFNSFTDFFKEVFMGINKFNYLCTITIMEYGGYFLFSLVFLLLFREPVSLAFGYTVSGIVVLFSGWRLLFKRHGKALIQGKEYIRKYAMPILKYAVPIAAISLGGMILVEMDTFMLGLLSSKENVAVYGIAKNLCSKATHVNYALTIGVMTTFSQISAEDYPSKRASFRKADRMNYVITAGVVIGFLLFGSIVIKILYGSQYSYAGTVINQLLLYYALYSVSNFYSCFLDFRNKAWSRSVWYLTVIVINLCLNLILIPKYGASGAAFATDFSLVPYTVYVICMTIREWKTIGSKHKA